MGDTANKCKLCGSPMTEETTLHQDCGGDCLLCMAQSGDTDCIETAFRLLLELREAAMALTLSMSTYAPECWDEDAYRKLSELVK